MSKLSSFTNEEIEAVFNSQFGDMPFISLEDISEEAKEGMMNTFPASIQVLNIRLGTTTKQAADALQEFVRKLGRGNNHGRD